MITVRHARLPADREAVLAIWHEFVDATGVDLSFQDNAADFADMAGRYAPPAGRLLLAETADDLVGCVALRRVDAAICEMKRLYVRATARGGGAGMALVERLIAEARAAGYAEMRLDVLAGSAAARGIYARFGFVEAPPVSFNPVPGTAFLGLPL